MYIQRSKYTELLGKGPALTALRRLADENKRNAPLTSAIAHTMSNVLTPEMAYQCTDIVEKRENKGEHSLFSRIYMFSMGRMAKDSTGFRGKDIEITLVSGWISEITPDYGANQAAPGFEWIIEAGLNRVKPGPENERRGLVALAKPQIGVVFPLEEERYGATMREIPIDCSERTYTSKLIRDCQDPGLAPLVELLTQMILNASEHFAEGRRVLLQ